MIRRPAGPALAFIGFGCFSAADLVTKLLMGAHGLAQVLVLSGLVMLAVMTAGARWLGGIQGVARGILALVVLRGLMSAGMIALSLHALSRMAIADVYALRFLAPLLIVMPGGLLIAEPPRARDLAAVLVGLAGVWAVLKPGWLASGAVVVDGAIPWDGAAAALGAAALQAASVLMLRRWHAASTPLVDAALPVMVTVLVALPFLLENGMSYGHGWIMPRAVEWAGYVAAGLFLAGGRLCLVFALRSAPAAVVAPAHYSQLLWGLAFGWLIFADRPDPISTMGALVIVAAGLMTARGARLRQA
jgi:drug/metabolite transporter (DMT)-like permease